MTTPSHSTYPLPVSKPLVLREQDIEAAFIDKLLSLKYTVRQDIRERAALEQNFRQKFEPLNRVRLTDGEVQCLLDELITPDVFTASRILREKNDFTRNVQHPDLRADWRMSNANVELIYGDPSLEADKHRPAPIGLHSNGTF